MGQENQGKMDMRLHAESGAAVRRIAQIRSMSVSDVLNRCISVGLTLQAPVNQLRTPRVDRVSTRLPQELLRQVEVRFQAGTDQAENTRQLCAMLVEAALVHLSKPDAVDTPE